MIFSGCDLTAPEEVDPMRFDLAVAAVGSHKIC
jgi:hypothetical protein